MKDEELRDCVNKEMPGMGDIMFLGVSLPGALVYWSLTLVKIVIPNTFNKLH